MQSILFEYPNLEIRAASVFDLLFRPHSLEPTESIVHDAWSRGSVISGVQLGQLIQSSAAFPSDENSRRFRGTTQMFSSSYLHWYLLIWRDTHRSV